MSQAPAIYLIVILSVACVPESTAWFHRPRCPKNDPKCNLPSRRDSSSSKRQVFLRSFDLNKLGPTVRPPSKLMLPVRVENKNRREAAVPGRPESRYRSRIHRHRFKIPRYNHT